MTVTAPPALACCPAEFKPTLAAHPQATCSLRVVALLSDPRPNHQPIVIQ